MAETASQRAVSVQSQGPSQLNSLSVPLLEHFKRWHINEPLLLYCIHLCMHRFDHTQRIICTSKNMCSHKYCTCIHRHKHARTHKTLQCSFLGWMGWQMTLFNAVSSVLCFASTAMGYSQVKEVK